MILYIVIGVELLYLLIGISVLLNIGYKYADLDRHPDKINWASLLRDLLSHLWFHNAKFWK